MGVILDTTVLIETERGRFDMPGFLESLGDEGVALAAVTAGELLFGFEQAGDPEIRVRRGVFVEAILETIPTIHFGLAEARRLAELWAELAKQGELIGPYDMLVAATALASDFTLATLNRREFERVPGLSLLEIDSFRSA
jgi:predicted nucleic acid-binding protein